MEETRLPNYDAKLTIFAKDAKEVFDWTFDFYDIKAIHERGYFGEGETIAILDTGLNEKHPDLFGTVVHSEDMRGSNDVIDRNYHSTWIHGRLSAVHNGVGVQGICPKAKIIILKVFNDNGSGNSEWLEKGIRRAHELGATQINFSGGLGVKIPFIEEAINDFILDGGTFWAANGNDGLKNDLDFPSNIPQTVAIGSHDENGSISNFSDFGAMSDIYSAGEDVLSTYGDKDYALLSGTSMATPTALGIFATLRLPLEKKLGFKITPANLHLFAQDINSINVKERRF